MSKVEVIGGAAAVALIVLFLVWRQMSGGKPKKQKQENQPYSSSPEDAKLELEETAKGLYRQIMGKIEAQKKARVREQKQVIKTEMREIMIRGERKIRTMQNAIYKEFGIVMLRPGFDMKNGKIADGRRQYRFQMGELS